MQMVLFFEQTFKIKKFIPKKQNKRTRQVYYQQSEWSCFYSSLNVHQVNWSKFYKTRDFTSLRMKFLT